MCGAPASTDDPLCHYCGSRLATVACASCFGVMILGSKHCPSCGAAAAQRSTVSLQGGKCPRCSVEMQPVAIGTTSVRECGRCLGLWVDIASFEKICADREQQAAVLGAASQAPGHAVQETDKVRYVPCPQCGQLMNRINFAHCSGVIVDICKGHGSWFDCEELSRIVEFIRGGGLEASRAREKAALEEQRRQLREEQHAADVNHTSFLGFGKDDEEHRGLGIASARWLLRHLLDD